MSLFCLPLSLSAFLALSLITDDTSKAEALREQYDSVFTKENLTNLPDIPKSPYGDIPDICFTACGIQSQLESIRPDKACGQDQIPTRVLKETATELAPVLASLFQQSFNIGILPSDWKYANITIIFKKGHRADPKNYRPVSLTSLTSQIMEHIVCKQICHHLSANSAIYRHQHGFQKGLSCETQLILIIHEWASILNINGQVDVIFLDFEKAFDSVPHERLLLKARFYGIMGKLHYWLRDFLSGRRQRIVVNRSSSKWSPVLLGVPQGTVLRPILFLLFINDLPWDISLSVKLFADEAYSSVTYRCQLINISYNMIWPTWKNGFLHGKWTFLHPHVTRCLSLWSANRIHSHMYSTAHL